MRYIDKTLAAVAALLIAAGGAVHLREWLDTYRDIPDAVPGSEVVKIGFPINTALSLVLAVALVATIFAVRHLANTVVVAALVFQIGSLAALVISREGSLFGWQESIWTTGAEQSRALEIAAIVCLVGVLAVRAVRHRAPASDRAGSVRTWSRAG